MVEGAFDPDQILGKVVASATSELRMFALKFEDGSGLLLEAGGTGTSPAVTVKLVPASELPDDTDAVCKVDWSWIQRSKLAKTSLSASSVTFTLEPAGPLQIAVQVWQGSPFLAFSPWKAR